MADTEYWTVPADAYVRGGGEYTITVLTPPYQVDSGRLPANDAVAARQFAEAFPTVEEVLEVLPDAPANEGLYLTTRTDLDLIRVGVWGNVIGISDPALIDDGTRFTMASETATVAERCPDARVVGRLAVDCGEDYTEDIARLPDGSRLHAGGYPGTEPWEVHGTPAASSPPSACHRPILKPTGCSGRTTRRG